MKCATFRLFLLLLLLAGPALSARAQHLPGEGRRAALQSILRADGTLAVPDGGAGVFDATGYDLATGLDGQPRFVAGSAAQAPAGDEDWDDRFGMPGVDGSVSVVAFHPNGDMYVGGSLYTAGGQEAVGIARWDGRRWWPLGEGLLTAYDGTGEARAIVFSGDDVYVGGSFRKAGGQVVNSVARWDGTRWWPLGSGVETAYGEGEVNALAFVGGRLYAGGAFEKAGGQQARGLAVWDGTQWAEVGGGVYSDIFGTSYNVATVRALVADGADLYVGGNLKFAGATPAWGLARLNTTTGAWTAFGEGLIQSEYSAGVVHDIALQGGDVYVAGEFAKAGTVDARNVARWDGTAWSVLGQGLMGQYSGRVDAIAFVGADLYAAGTFDTADGAAAKNIAKWTGTAWQPLVSDGINGLPEAYAVAALTEHDGALYVGGDFDEAGLANVRNVTRWDPAASKWHAYGEGISNGSYGGRVNAVAVAPNGDVYVGGSFYYAGGLLVNSIARWDGTRWHALGNGLETTPGSYGYVYTIAIDGNDVYVGGSFSMAGGRAVTNIARWDAAAGTWNALGSGVSGSGRVNDIALGHGYVYAAGDFTAAGTVSVDDVARWDGTAWSALGKGISFGYSSLSTIEVAGQYVFVGGDFSYVRPPSATDDADVDALIAWDSQADEWYAFDVGLRRAGSSGDYAGSVNDLQLIGTDLYVAGDFDKAGTVAAYQIARLDLDAGTWHALDSNVGGDWPDVNALAAHGGDLYAAGSFKTAGDQTVNAIARWDGTAWTPLGSGITYSSFGSVDGLAIQGDDLYAVGNFQFAGGKPSMSIAHYRLAGGETPAGQALIAVDPTTVNFGDVTVGQPEVLMITIRNEANATANLSGTVGMPDAPFRIDEGGGAFMLAPGASREVIVAFAPEAAGAFEGRLTITHDAANQAGPVTVTLRGNGVRTIPGPTVLRNFDPTQGPDPWPIDRYMPIDSGFVFGTNVYRDRAKAVLLTPPAGKQASFTVTKVRVWFGYKSPQVGNETFTLSLYEGSSDAGPAGTPLYSQVVRVADIRADADLATAPEATEFALARAVTVDGPFFVVIDFGDYVKTDLFTVAAGDLIEQRVPEAWEQWEDGTWHNVSDAWTPQGQPALGWQPWIEAVNEAVTATVPAAEVPAAVALDQNYPNPFNPATQIRYTLDAAAPVRLAVYDVQGRLVRMLVDGVQPAGAHSVAFEAGTLPSGTYFYRLETPRQTFTRPMVLLR